MESFYRYARWWKLWEGLKSSFCAGRQYWPRRTWLDKTLPLSPCQTDPFQTWPKKTDGVGSNKQLHHIVQHPNYEFKYESLELILMSVWRTAWLNGCVRKVHPLVADWSRGRAFKACEPKRWCDRGSEDPGKQANSLWLHQHNTSWKLIYLKFMQYHRSSQYMAHFTFHPSFQLESL